MAMKKKLLFINLLILLVTIGFQVGFVTPCYSYSTNINTPYYQQQTNIWCGPASAQMILESENVKNRLHSDYPISASTYSKQETLWNYIQAHNITTTPVNWATDPQGLRDTLDYYDTLGSYIIAKYTDARTASNYLLWSIDMYGVPGAALIYDGDHWIVVKGFQTNVKPRPGSTYEFRGFWIHDPWYESNSLGSNRYITWNQ